MEFINFDQDGKDAGQTIPHVHVIPRRPGDLPCNDDIYKKASLFFEY